MKYFKNQSFIFSNDGHYWRIIRFNTTVLLYKKKYYDTTGFPIIGNISEYLKNNPSCKAYINKIGMRYNSLEDSLVFTTKKELRNHLNYIRFHKSFEDKLND